MPQNLEQIRAAHALPRAAGLDRSAVNKLPGMLLANGLLATAAFCNAEGSSGNRGDLKSALTATAAYLASREVIAQDKASIKGLIEDLSVRDSLHLQRATSEALAYLSYLKRFAPKKS